MSLHEKWGIAYANLRAPERRALDRLVDAFYRDAERQGLVCRIPPQRQEGSSHA